MSEKIPKSFKMDKLIVKKFEYIAELESRNFSSQLTHVIKRFIKDYEKDHDLLHDKDYLTLIDEHSKDAK